MKRLTQNPVLVFVAFSAVFLLLLEAARTAYLFIDSVETTESGTTLSKRPTFSLQRKWTFVAGNAGEVIERASSSILDGGVQVRLLTPTTVLLGKPHSI